MKTRRMSAAMAVAVLSGAAAGQPCQPRWSTEFVGNAPDGPVFGAAPVDLGQGASLYIGGRFSNTGSVPASGIAEYRAGTWATLGSGIPSPFNSHGFIGCCTMVKSIIRGTHAGQPVIHVSGDFVIAGGNFVESVANYRSGTWSDLAGGMAMPPGCADCPTRVYALQNFDDGSGMRLYAAGGFFSAGGVEAKGIASWNGNAWSPVGGGLGNAAPIPEDAAWIETLAVFGKPARLYAGGFFGKIGNTETLCIARWTGSAWEAVGGGMTIPKGGATPAVKAMIVHDDGSGAALYIGGSFSLAGGVPARNIARWSGTAWSAVGAGVGSGVNDMVLALEVFNDGTGPALYAGGQFDDAGGAQARGLAKWNGSAWSEVGGGIRGFNIPGDTPSVQALTVHDDGTGQGLYVGGWFAGLGETVMSPYLGKWIGCTCYANCDGSTGTPALTGNDFQCFANRFAEGAAYANCDGSTGTPALTANDFQCFVNRFAAGCP